MSGMVQAAVAGDIAEAEEMQEILRNVGIDSTITGRIFAGSMSSMPITSPSTLQTRVT